MKFGKAAERDIWSLLLGKKLGKGAARTVYEYAPDPRYVVKVESDRGSFQNVAELKVWQAVQGTEFERWFAPVQQISGGGIFLLMRRTEPARAAEYPERLPAFFTDLKRPNFGMLDGKFVAHDYGTFPIVMLSRALTKATRKAEWWA